MGILFNCTHHTIMALISICIRILGGGILASARLIAVPWHAYAGVVVREAAWMASCGGRDDYFAGCAEQ